MLISILEIMAKPAPRPKPCLDIIEDAALVKSAATRAAVLFSAIIGEKVTELLDIPAILKAAEFHATQPAATAKTAAAGAN